MLYQIIDKNGVIINWRITKDRAEALKKIYDIAYPESEVKIIKQDW